MKKNNILLEFEDRYCPICGNLVKAGSNIHSCLDKDLKKIEEELKKIDEKIEERTYDDKLDEFDKFYNSDNYYDNDIEEE